MASAVIKKWLDELEAALERGNLRGPNEAEQRFLISSMFQLCCVTFIHQQPVPRHHGSILESLHGFVEIVLV